MAGEAKRRQAATLIGHAPSPATGAQQEAARLALDTIGSGGGDQELEQQLLIFSRRARALGGELAKANAIIAGKNGQIAELEKRLASLEKSNVKAVGKKA